MKKILFLFALFLGSMYLYLFTNPYERVLRADNENDSAYFYLTLYWRLLTRKEAVELLKKLVIENNDYQTMLAVSFFCKDNEICELVNVLNHDVEFVTSWPIDTVWRESIRSYYKREISRNGFLNETTLNNCKELTRMCEGK